MNALSALTLISCLAIGVAALAAPPDDSSAGEQTAEDEAKSAAARTVEVVPSDTDSRIKTSNEPHVAWVPSGPARNQLLVYLPGTGGKPRARFRFNHLAAKLGYHAVFLNYPDDVSSQSACSRSADPDAYMKFRLAIIRGGVASEKEQISQADSIENRLTKLLIYLGAKQPGQGWDQFLDQKKQVDWGKIVIAGGSQGGGHAYVISKIHTVARVIMFASPKDFSHYFKRPAMGFYGKTRTPLDRYFAFNHLEDNGHGCTHIEQLAILQQIGLTELGVANADESGPQFNNAHVIFTDVQLPDPKEYHTSVVEQKIPICPVVWRYVLTAAVK